MNEQVDLILELAREQMDKAIEHLEKEFKTIRAGKANPGMLANVMVEYYGSKTSLSQVANINTPDSRTILVQPWEKSMLVEVEKAIMVANLGLNPMNNGEVIIINIPPLTQERRIELSKQVKAITEHDKVSIRNVRKEANTELKNSDFSEDLIKNTEQDIQSLTDSYIKKIDDLYQIKYREIMTV